MRVRVKGKLEIGGGDKARMTVSVTVFLWRGKGTPYLMRERVCLLICGKILEELEQRR